jgi:hypothetical protein
VSDRYGNEAMALPLLAFNASQKCPIASTWGFDLLVKDQIDLIDEKRIYSVQESIEGAKLREE